ncbi:hypothetical protein [Microbacterium sp. USHLN186]|uniref:hypothetical protein n=1 Tax=Microbacterium sp. USHLN186 TaxID=3081286 RepID=UPI0030165AC2
MNAHAAEAHGYVPAVETSIPSVNIDPDFHLPAERGNGFVRAFRILFPKAA